MCCPSFVDGHTDDDDKEVAMNVEIWFELLVVVLKIFAAGQLG